MNITITKSNRVLKIKLKTESLKNLNSYPEAVAFKILFNSPNTINESEL